ncbi:hypothetical protein CAL7716_100260 (plasmid) [Calothrix sp. PCC 7716]|nr:hypothetical protein CAL7716_100260 [Calothrix sp. PCC 7716]
MYCADFQLFNPDSELAVISIAEEYNLSKWLANYENGHRILSLAFETSDNLFMFLRHISLNCDEDIKIRVTKVYFDTD